MKERKATKNRQHKFSLSNYKILMVEDKRELIASIKFEAEKRGIRQIVFVNGPSEAVEILKHNEFDIVSSDFDLSEEQEGTNGVGLLKYIAGQEGAKLKKLIYTYKSEEIKGADAEWCEQNRVKIVAKTRSHENLFMAMESFFPSYALLPDVPIYANLEDGEMLLALASELIAELKAKKDEYTSFGGGTEPISYGDLLAEVEALSPIGKEYLGTWFSSIKTSLFYLEKEKNKK